MALVLPAQQQEPATRIGSKRIRQPPRITLGELTPNNVGVLRKLNAALFPVAYSDRFYKDVLDTVLTPEEYSKLVFYQDLAVGAIVTRLQPASTPPPATVSTSLSVLDLLPTASSSTGTALKVLPTPTVQPHKLYIMTLGVLAPYRRQGLASTLVQHIIAQAEASHLPPVANDIKIKLPTDDSDDKKKKVDKVDKPAVVVVRPVVTELYLHVQVSNVEARTFWEGHGFEVTSTVESYYRKISPKDAWLMERKITSPAGKE